MKERVVILGGGGHAKVVIDILEQAAEFAIAGFLSPAEQPDEICGYRRLGSDGALDEVLRSGVASAFVASGDNQRRMDSIALVRRHGFTLVNAISPAAMVSPRATLRAGIAVMPGAVINAGSLVEDGAIVNTNATVDHDCVVGAGAHVAPGTTLAGCVRLGDGVFLGTGSSVIPGIAIGSWTTVGAGAVVVADLPDHVVAVGVPAIIRRCTRGAA